MKKLIVLTCLIIMTTCVWGFARIEYKLHRIKRDTRLTRGFIDEMRIYGMGGEFFP